MFKYVLSYESFMCYNVKNGNVISKLRVSNQQKQECNRSFLYVLCRDVIAPLPERVILLKVYDLANGEDNNHHDIHVSPYKKLELVNCLLLVPESVHVPRHYGVNVLRLL